MIHSISIDMCAEMAKELAGSQEQVYALLSTLETKLRPPESGSDSDTDYTAWRLCEVARDLLSDTSLVNRLQDALNGQGGLAEPMSDPGISDAELVELQH